MPGDDRLFSLTENPFALMGLTPRSSRDQIEIAAGRGGAGWAAGVLLDPYQRLTEEVAWLPGASGQGAKEAVAALAAGDQDRVRQAIMLLRGLAKANICADAALRFSDPELVEQLARAWEAVDPAEVLAQVNADRMISGFPQANAAQVDWALQAVRARHSGAAARVLSATGAEGRERLFRLVERPSTSGKVADLKLIEALVTAYGAEQKAELDSTETSILNEVDAMTRNGRDATDRLEMLFDTWQELARPALALARLKGRDDARALTLVGDMRVIYLDPSAGPGRVGPAGRVAQTLMSRFADSPLILRMVSADAMRLGAGGIAPASGVSPEASAAPMPEADRTHRQAAKQARRDAAQLTGAGQKSTRAPRAGAQSSGGAAREQLLAAVRARFQAEQAKASQAGQAAQATPGQPVSIPAAKKKGCGCTSWLVPIGIAVFFIVKALLKADPQAVPPAVTPPAPEQPAASAPLSPPTGTGASSATGAAPVYTAGERSTARGDASIGEGPPTVFAETDGGGGRR